MTEIVEMPYAGDNYRLVFQGAGLWRVVNLDTGAPVGQMVVTDSSGKLEACGEAHHQAHGELILHVAREAVRLKLVHP